jgi:endonuclease/exonuclease/phosphatase family metal-dependent hydrolase
MTAIEPGTYNGVSEGMTFEFRIEEAAGAGGRALSGDISRGAEFVASFICTDPQPSDAGRTITGPLAFRGHPELFTGRLYLNSDERGVGSFQVAVDLEGGYRDVFAGRLDWQGSFLRRLTIEIDGIEGAGAPAEYVTRAGTKMSVARAFEQAGFDVQIVVDPFAGRGVGGDRVRGYTLAEIHAAMSDRRSHVTPDRLHAHVFVCSYLAERDGRGVLGVMYDFDEHDLNQRPREGVAVFYDHPMLSDPRVPPEERNKEYIYTLVHEIGHALNLLHSFDKARPTALSWMNYPHLYPRGYEAGRGHDGTQEFWRRFEERFDEEELRHLRHASPREIRSGGFAFGVYEEGASIPFGGTADPRRTRLGANPLRATRTLDVQLRPLKEEYHLGEPVFLSLSVTNRGSDAAHVPASLHPNEGYVRLTVRTPTGRIIRYRPPVRMCKQSSLFHLPPGESMPGFDSIPLFLSADGPIFTEPGIYQIAAELTGVDGAKNVFSPPTRLMVKPPDRATEAFAYRLWDNSDALKALYLGHPLVSRDGWSRLEEEAAGAGLAQDNTTESFINYVAGHGWLTPFATPGTNREKGANPEKAAERFRRVNPEGLPAGVATRREKVLRTCGGGREDSGSALRENFLQRLSARRPAAPERRGRDVIPAAEPGTVQPGEAAAETKGAEERASSVVGNVAVTSHGTVVTRPEELARGEVPPAGLFGLLGLDRPGEEPDRPLDPFARVVPTLRGTSAFADVISWNIEHLHAPKNFHKIPKIANLIRGFRCDFWGLQEVDETSLAKLVEGINSMGNVRYDFVAVEGKGQQSGAIFRTDTTSVRVLKAPKGLFNEELRVKLRSGEEVPRSVFHRQPLLCEVRVRQQGGGTFDFRCAVAHLKSTDSELKDTGNELRARGAAALARWIEMDMEEVGELDYLIMGDMNAETAQQGLGAFAKGNDLKLLSVGMRDKFGEVEALTRVASRRLLDHIVVTGSASALMPKEDEDEQIIIRSDQKLGDWTTAFSDHVPVAVRFVIGEDSD